LIDQSTLRQATSDRNPWVIAILLASAVAIALVIIYLPLWLAAGLIFLLLFLALTLTYPLFGLGVALLLGPFGALESIVIGTPLLDSGQLALLFAFAAWLSSGLARRRLVIPRTQLNLPLILFILIALLSLVDSRSVVSGLIETIKWLEMLLIIWLIVDISLDEQHHPRRYANAFQGLLVALLLAGLIQAMIGIWQFGPRGHGPEHFMVLGRFFRAYGTFEQPNPFGGFMNMSALLAVGIVIGLLHSRKSGSTGLISFGKGRYYFPWLAFATLCAAASLLAVVFSWSRGAWLGLIAGAIILVMFSSNRLRNGLLLLFIIGFIGTGVLLVGASRGYGSALSIAGRLSGFQEEFTLGDVRGVDINDANYAVLERLAHWQAAVDMARDNLWTGVGFGNYETAYENYALINWPAALGHAHNYYLNLLAEVGLFGLIAYLLFWLVVAWQSLKLIPRLMWPERGVVVGFLAVFAALAVHHLVDKLYVNNVYVHLGVMLGLLQLLAWPGYYGRRTVESP
jgi:putative inorganic carbon (hco3(-)) transporter